MVNIVEAVCMEEQWQLHAMLDLGQAVRQHWIVLMENMTQRSRNASVSTVLSVFINPPPLQIVMSIFSYIYVLFFILFIFFFFHASTGNRLEYLEMIGCKMWASLRLVIFKKPKFSGMLNSISSITMGHVRDDFIWLQLQN